jgi:hypothetical protein
MRTISETFVLPCDSATFWRTFVDERYIKALFMEELKHKELTILELTDRSRKVRAVPTMNVPGFIEKLVGGFAYEEHGTLDPAKNEWTWRVHQPEKTDGSKAKKALVTTRGSVRLSDAGDGKTRRTNEVHVEAKVFAVGGIIESNVEKEMRSMWTKELAFLTRWLEKRPNA